MKRALVLSGGGNKGAFEVGALSYLIQNYGLSFDLFSGTSVGALNCAYLAQGTDLKAQTDKIEFLKQKWFAISGTRDIYHFSFLNIIGLLFGGSLCQPAGLKKLINTLIIPEHLENGKPLLIPTVALEDGELYIADSRNAKDREDMAKFILASASIPVYFPSVNIRGKHWADGGLRDITPLSAITDENPQEIIVITTYPITSNFEPVFPPFKKVNNIFSVIHRVIDILTAEIGSNDLRIVKQARQRNLSWLVQRGGNLMVISPDDPLTESSLNVSVKSPPPMKI
jgi:NTE family protein